VRLASIRYVYYSIVPRRETQNTELGLAGKVALITGGSEGIGKATALALGLEGAAVAIVARRPELLASAAEELRSWGVGQVLTVTADVTHAGDPERAVALVNTVAEANEVAQVIAVRASEAASYVMGTAINVDGGSASAV
jgi:NAD(P)-dependent dehydrogenase (short-subunit alcohol dehydrogenase family)